jgi:hypothetical protein
MKRKKNKGNYEWSEPPPMQTSVPKQKRKKDFSFSFNS